MEIYSINIKIKLKYGCKTLNCKRVLNENNIKNDKWANIASGSVNWHET